MPSHRIHWKYRLLYVGRDHDLTSFLKDALKRLDCFVVRCPRGTEARIFIESEIRYSLFLFDEELPDMTGLELKRFTHSQAHRKKIPILIVAKSGDFNNLLEAIIRTLAM
jgi:DNA-binding response OmpR family regulator